MMIKGVAVVIINVGSVGNVVVCGDIKLIDFTMTSFELGEGVEVTSFAPSTICTKGIFVTVFGCFVGTKTKFETGVRDGPVLRGVLVLIVETTLAGGEGMVFGLD